MNQDNPILKYVQPRKLVWPILLGVGVAIYYWINHGRSFDWSGFKWRENIVLYVVLAIILLCFREIGYAIRLRVLSSQKLSWRACFELTFLWELASAISPGAIGGTAVALVLLAQEKINTGTSTAIVLATSFLDELFFVLLVPIIFAFVGFNDVFYNVGSGAISASNLALSFWIGYAVLFVWTFVLGVGLLLKPYWIGSMIYWLFKKTRWSKTSKSWSEDLVIASDDLRLKPFMFWAKGFGATCFSWLSRYALVNCLFLMAVEVNDHVLIYARQLVMWVILMVPVTPGASGLAEIIFPGFFGSFLPQEGLPEMMALLWRGISYYPFIIIGLITLYFWIKRLQSFNASSVS